MNQSHLIQLINNHKNDNNWKIQLTMNVNFTPAEDFNDKRTKTKNSKIMMRSDTNEIVNELFDSIIQKYRELLDHSTRDSGLVFEGVESMTYDINKTIINRSGSYIESPTWLKSKKCTINPQNQNDNNCFHYAVTVAMNYDEINNHPEKISKSKPFIDQYNWDDINFPRDQKDWKKFESNNKPIALNIFMYHIILKILDILTKVNLILPENTK